MTTGQSPDRRRTGRLWALLTAGLLAAAGCTGAVVTPSDAPPVTSVYLVSHGWHVGVAIRASDVPADLCPETRDCPAADWHEVGWGDWDYYQIPEPGLAVTLKAALWPTPSVLHVAAVGGPVEEYFRGSEVLALPVTAAGLRRLVEFIDTTHARRGVGPVGSLGPGLYGDSRYYPARGRFHVFNNCNTWVGKALRAAGYDIGPAITAADLMSQARRLADRGSAPDG